MKKDFIFSNLTDEEMAHSLSPSEHPRYSQLSDTQKQIVIDGCKLFVPLSNTSNDKMDEALESVNPRVFQSDGRLLVWEQDFIDIPNMVIIGKPANRMTVIQTSMKASTQVFFNNLLNFK